MSSDRNRQPKGVPTGGEFAKNDHGDAPGILSESAFGHIPSDGVPQWVSADAFRDEFPSLNQCYLSRDPSGDLWLRSTHFVSERHGFPEDSLRHDIESEIAGKKYGAYMEGTVMVVDSRVDESANSVEDGIGWSLRESSARRISEDYGSGAWQKSVQDAVHRDRVLVEGLASPEDALAHASSLRAGFTHTDISGEQARALVGYLDRDPMTAPGMVEFRRTGKASARSIEAELHRLPHSDDPVVLDARFAVENWVRGVIDGEG